MCQEPWYFTQWPAVITVLPLALVTESPEQEAVRPPNVKNTRPEVFTTAPPPVHGPPAWGKAVGATAAGAAEAGVGAISVGRSDEAAGVRRTVPGAATASSGTALRIRSAVQKPSVCRWRNEAGPSAAAAGAAPVRAPAIKAPAARRTDAAVR
ncbi:hypothetical protein GCM10009731_58180 [Streptomyces globosus]